jgi:putative phage-type endonuclease
MKIHNMEQGSDEWHEIRKLKLTASHAQEISAAGKGLETYTTKIISEYFSSKEKEHYSNTHIERGNELESEARAIYELETGNKVDQVGFIEYSEYVGCSPDGLIGDDGGLEIKCNDDKIFTEYILNGKISSAYIWQVQMSLLITKRKWWDFVSYNPNFKKPLNIIRIEPDPLEESQAKLLKGFEVGTNLLREKKEAMSQFLK